MKRKASSRFSVLFGTCAAHLIIIIALMYLVLFSIDIINSAMEFINNGITKTLMAVMALLGIINGICALLAGRRRSKKRTGSKAGHPARTHKPDRPQTRDVIR